MYEQAKSSLLSRYNWSFAIHKNKLSKIDNSKDPLQEYAYAYALPDRFLRVFMVYGADKRPVVYPPKGKPAYTIEGQKLLTDESTCIVKYVYDENDVSKFSPLFVNCLVLDIAIRLTRIFQSSSAYQQQLMAEYQVELANAKICDCQQVPFYHNEISPLFNRYWNSI